MAVEIERKFLVRGEGWREGATATPIRQGYLSTDPDRIVRVRTAGSRAFLTVKGRASGARRLELEVEIPLADAIEMLALCKGAIVDKARHQVAVAGFVWEVDEFQGDNAGLVVAELEVKDEQDFALALGDPPAWLGRDVSDDRRLSNSYLAERPFSTWTAEERAPYVATTS